MNYPENYIVNADDFGLKSSVNKAIINSFESGKINSTSLMTNMPGFEEAVNLAHESKIIDKIGVHLVITDGKSLTDEINQLNFVFDGNMNTASRLCNLLVIKKLKQELFFKEYSAQIEKVINNGIKITHLDTHHQIHDMWGIVQVIIRLLDKYEIPSMRILNNLEPSKFYKNFYRNHLNKYLFRKKINFSDFMGNFQDYQLYAPKYPNFFDGKSVEIMVHPDIDETGKLVDRIGFGNYRMPDPLSI